MVFQKGNQLSKLRKIFKRTWIFGNIFFELKFPFIWGKY
jgi:hypothetical protein